MKDGQPPQAPKKDHWQQMHGKKWNDPWFWLRYKDEDPDVMDYLHAENAYTASVMQDTNALQDELYREMRDRILEDDSSVPVREGNYEYWWRYREGDQYPSYCRRKVDGNVQLGDDEVLLNVNDLAESYDYYQLGVCKNSPDHRLLAYSADTDGAEKFTLLIKDLQSGQHFEERIEGTSRSFAWANDNRTFFYTVLDKNHRPLRLYRHHLGQDPAKDELIFEEDDPRFFLSVSRSLSGRIIYLVINGNNMAEWHYLRSDQPFASFQLIQPRSQDHEYMVKDQGDSFVILTNLNAKDFKLVTTPIAKPGSANWQDFVTHRAGRLMEEFVVFKNFIAILVREKSIPHIWLYDLTSARWSRIQFQEEAYTLVFQEGREYATDQLRFIYSSLTTPQQTYDYNMQTGERQLKKEQPVLGDFRSDDYVTKRVFVSGHDGARIPVTLLYHKNTDFTEPPPCCLMGYGAYGIIMPPVFRSFRLSLVDRGIIYGIAHVRGGMDMGWDWYENGKLLNKKNTFYDYIATAEALIEQGYTRADRLIGTSGSAGGILMGAVANWRPDLFRGIVMHVPFVDVLNTMLDATLPLTKIEYNEWGNPNQPEYFEYIGSYSPYDQINEQAYPHMLVVAGLNDMRVTYWEPAKWVAKLREYKTDNRHLLLNMQMGFGHGGASGRFAFLKDRALDYAFMLKILGQS